MFVRHIFLHLSPGVSFWAYFINVHHHCRDMRGGVAVEGWGRYPWKGGYVHMVWGALISDQSPIPTRCETLPVSYGDHSISIRNEPWFMVNHALHLEIH